MEYKKYYKRQQKASDEQLIIFIFILLIIILFLLNKILPTPYLNPYQTVSAEIVILALVFYFKYQKNKKLQERIEAQKVDAILNKHIERKGFMNSPRQPKQKLLIIAKNKRV